MTQAQKKNELSVSEWVGQIEGVCHRLRTLPLGHHESAALRDCLCAALDTLLGKRVESATVEQSGLVPVSGHLTNKGVEIAPGVVVELPDEPIPREAENAFEVGSPVHDPRAGAQMPTGVAESLPTPLPGSIAAGARGIAFPRERVAPGLVGGKPIAETGLKEPETVVDPRADTKDGE